MGVDVAPGQGVTFPMGELGDKLGDPFCRKGSTSRDFLAQPGRDLAGRGVWESSAFRLKSVNPVRTMPG